MLSEIEERRLNILYTIIQNAKEGNTFPRLTAYDIEWLVIRLKELNTELTETKDEVTTQHKSKAHEPCGRESCSVCKTGTYA